MKIKICGNNNAQNAQKVDALRPDLMGFIFYPGSKRFVKPEAARSIISRLRHAEPVGVFVDHSPSDVLGICKTAGIKIVQLHGSEPASSCRMLKASGLTVIKSFGIGKDFNPGILRSYEDHADMFLFDTASPMHGGTGKSFDWKLVMDNMINTPFFMSGGIGPENIGQLLVARNENFIGIDVNSRIESDPGIKDIAKAKSIIQKTHEQDVRVDH